MEDEEEKERMVNRIALKSASDFFQLPKKLFTNNHKVFGPRDQAEDINEITAKNQAQNQNVEESKEATRKQNAELLDKMNQDPQPRSVKIRFDETVSSTTFRAKEVQKS